MKNRSVYIPLLLSFIFASTLSAQTVNAPVHGRDVTKSVRVETIVGREAEYHYLSMSKPNPFIPPLVSSLVTSLELPIESSLQRFSLSDIKVVGIWTLRTGEKKAMIIMPNTEGVTIVKGTMIGRRGGFVSSIDESSVTVREFSLSSDGTKQFEDIHLWLEDPKPEGEKTIFMHADSLSDPLTKGYGSKNYLNLEKHESQRKELIQDSANLNLDIVNKEDSRMKFPNLFENQKKKEEPKTDAKAPIIENKPTDLINKLGTDKESLLKNVKPSTGE